jgi:hypothetical protein
VSILWCPEGIKPSKIYRTTVQYGGNCMSQRKAYEWLQTFKGGRTEVDGAG